MLDQALPNYSSAQFTFAIVLAKKGDLSNDFARKAQRGLMAVLEMDDLEIYHGECRWIANRAIGAAQVTSPEWGATVREHHPLGYGR